jgi:hypothetical protein
VPRETVKAKQQAIISTPPGVITAFAGTGVRGYSPSSTPASSAMLDSPSGLAIAPDGAIFVSDTGNNRVVKFSGSPLTMSVVVASQTAGNGKPYRNLLVNPRAEAPIVTTGAIPGWTIPTGGATWSEIPWVATRPEPLDGEQFFRADPSSAATIFQDVSVTDYAAAIQAGMQSFAFSGFVHSLSGDLNPDATKIIVDYFDGTSNAPVYRFNSQDIKNKGEWQLVTDAHLAPTTTVRIRVTLVSTRFTGTGNDAY